MHTTLHFTQAEQQLFSALPAELREGWTVEDEVLTYEDDAEHRQVRLDLMELDEGKFERIILDCGPEVTEEKLEELIAQIDLSHMSPKDLWEMSFALGSEAMSYLIAKLILEVKTDTQIEAICALADLRHEFLVSVQ